MGTSRPRPIIVLVAVSLHLLLALGFAALRVAGTPPPLRALEWPGDLALALAYALPPLLALLALAGRPAALLAACVLSVPLAFTALSGVSVVLLVPAALYAVGYARWRPRPPLRATTLGLLAAVVVLGAAAFPALLASPAADTMYCWSATVGPDGHKQYGRHVERRPQGAGQGSLHIADGGTPGTISEWGCSTGIVEPPQAAASVAVAAAALACGLLLPRRTPPAS